MQQQRAAEAAAAEAARQAAIQAQNTSAQQQQQSGQALASQGLSSQNIVQQAKDQAALSASTAAGQAGAGATTGGGFNINAAKQQALNNLGAAAGTLPQTQANVVGGAANAMNPAVAGASNYINQIGNTPSSVATPSVSGIKFGGY